MEVRAAQDAYADLHEKAPYHDGTFTSWNEKRTTGFPFHHSHGVSFGAAGEDLTPWDLFTTERDASPVPPTPKPDADPRSGPGADPEEANGDQTLGDGPAGSSDTADDD